MAPASKKSHTEPELFEAATQLSVYVAAAARGRVTGLCVFHVLPSHPFGSLSFYLGFTCTNYRAERSLRFLIRSRSDHRCAFATSAKWQHSKG
jgi:hypothetical protein